MFVVEEILELHPINNVIAVDPRDVDRFVSKIIRYAGTDCWGYVGAKDPSGYGRFTLAGVPVPSHRLSYELSVGRIPPGRHVHHRCENPGCINPYHLEVLTPAEHVAKSVNHPKNKTHCKRGHEFTKENTHLYNGFRRCRACACLRFKVKRNALYQESGAVSSLYCKRNHPLFGENSKIVRLATGCYRRLCRTCLCENAARHRADNREAVLAARACRRAQVLARRIKQNEERAIELVRNIEHIPAVILVPLLRRLVLWR